MKWFGKKGGMWLIVLVIAVPLVSAITNTVFSDMDGDGDLDVHIEISLQNQGTEFFRRNATDGIGNVPNYTQSYFVNANGAGREDLYIVRENSTNELYLNNDAAGAISFTNASATALGLRLAGTNYSAPGTAFADFDGDGDVDAFVNGELWITNASFADVNATNISNIDELPALLQVKPIDFNNDTKVDILATSLTGSVIVFLNNGDGNGDGVPEFYDATLDMQINISDATFVEAGDIESGVAYNFSLTPVVPGTAPVLADIFNDLFIARNGTQRLMLQLWPRLQSYAGFPGRFYIPELFETNISSMYSGAASSAIIADFDKNAYNDVFIGAHDNTSAIVFRNGNSWNVSFVNSTIILNQSPDVKFAQSTDLNGDGNLDIALRDAPDIYFGSFTSGESTFEVTDPANSPGTATEKIVVVEGLFGVPTAASQVSGVNEIFGQPTFYEAITAGATATVVGLDAAKGVVTFSFGSGSMTPADIEDPSTTPTEVIVGGQGGGSGSVTLVCITSCVNGKPQYSVYQIDANGNTGDIKQTYPTWHSCYTATGGRVSTNAAGMLTFTTPVGGARYKIDPSSVGADAQVFDQAFNQWLKTGTNPENPLSLTTRVKMLKQQYAYDDSRTETVCPPVIEAPTFPVPIEPEEPKEPEPVITEPEFILPIESYPPSEYFSPISYAPCEVGNTPKERQEIAEKRREIMEEEKKEEQQIKPEAPCDDCPATDIEAALAQLDGALAKLNSPASKRMQQSMWNLFNSRLGQLGNAFNNNMAQAQVNNANQRSGLEAQRQNSFDRQSDHFRSLQQRDESIQQAQQNQGGGQGFGRTSWGGGGGIFGIGQSPTAYQNAITSFNNYWNNGFNTINQNSILAANNLAQSTINSMQAQANSANRRRENMCKAYFAAKKTAEDALAAFGACCSGANACPCPSFDIPTNDFCETPFDASAAQAGVSSGLGSAVGNMQSPPPGPLGLAIFEPEPPSGYDNVFAVWNDFIRSIATNTPVDDAVYVATPQEVVPLMKPAELTFNPLVGPANEAQATSIIEQTISQERKVVENYKRDRAKHLKLLEKEAKSERAQIDKEMRDAASEKEDIKRRLATVLKARQSRDEWLDDALVAESVAFWSNVIDQTVAQLDAVAREQTAVEQELEDFKANMPSLGNVDAVLHEREEILLAKTKRYGTYDHVDEIITHTQLPAEGITFVVPHAVADALPFIGVDYRERSSTKGTGPTGALTIKPIDNEGSAVVQVVWGWPWVRVDDWVKKVINEAAKCTTELIVEKPRIPPERITAPPTEVPPTKVPGEPTKAPPTEVPGEPTKAPPGEPTEVPPGEPTKAPPIIEEEKCPPPWLETMPTGSEVVFGNAADATSFLLQNQATTVCIQVGENLCCQRWTGPTQTPGECVPKCPAAACKRACYPTIEQTTRSIDDLFELYKPDPEEILRPEDVEALIPCAPSDPDGNCEPFSGGGKKKPQPDGGAQELEPQIYAYGFYHLERVEDVQIEDTEKELSRVLANAGIDAAFADVDVATRKLAEARGESFDIATTMQKGKIGGVIVSRARKIDVASDIDAVARYEQLSNALTGNQVLDVLGRTDANDASIYSLVKDTNFKKRYAPEKSIDVAQVDRAFTLTKEMALVDTPADADILASLLMSPDESEKPLAERRYTDEFGEMTDAAARELPKEGEILAVEVINLARDTGYPSVIEKGTPVTFRYYLQDSRMEATDSQNEFDEANTMITRVFEIVSNMLNLVTTDPVAAQDEIEDLLKSTSPYFYFTDLLFSDLNLLFENSVYMAELADIQNRAQKLAELMQDTQPLSQQQKAVFDVELEKLKADLAAVRAKLPELEKYSYFIERGDDVESPTDMTSPPAEEAPAQAAAPEETEEPREEPERQSAAEREAKRKAGELIDRGRMELKDEQYEAAVKSFAEAVRLDPARTDAQWLLANALSKAGEPHLAQNVVERIAQLPDLDDVVAKNLLEVVPEQDKTIAAQRAFEQLAQDIQSAQATEADERKVDAQALELFDICLPENHEFVFDGVKYVFDGVFQRKIGDQVSYVVKAHPPLQDVREFTVDEFVAKLKELHLGVCEISLPEEEPKQREPDYSKGKLTTNEQGEQVVCVPDNSITGSATGSFRCVEVKTLPVNIQEAVLAQLPTPIEPFEQDPVRTQRHKALQVELVFKTTERVGLTTFEFEPYWEYYKTYVQSGGKLESRLPAFMHRFEAGKNLEFIERRITELTDADFEALEKVEIPPEPACTFNGGVSCEGLDECAVKNGEIICTKMFSSECTTQSPCETVQQCTADQYGKQICHDVQVTELMKSGCAPDEEYMVENPGVSQDDAPWACPGFDECEKTEQGVSCATRKYPDCTFKDASTVQACEGFEEGECAIKDGALSCEAAAPEEVLPSGCETVNGELACAGYLTGACEDVNGQVVCDARGKVPQGCSLQAGELVCEDEAVLGGCTVTDGKMSCEGFEGECGFAEGEPVCWQEPVFEGFPEECLLVDGEMVCGEGIRELSSIPQGCSVINDEITCYEPIDMKDCTFVEGLVECPGKPAGACGFKGNELTCVEATTPALAEGCSFETGELVCEGYAAGSCGFVGTQVKCFESEETVPQGCTMTENEIVCGGASLFLPKGCAVQAGQLSCNGKSPCYFVNNVLRCET